MEPSISDLVKLPPALLKTLPAGKPPPGVLPKFDDPHSTGPLLIIFTTIFLVLALLFYINRISTKLLIVKRLSWDDLIITIGLIGTISMYGGAIQGVTKGPIGRHQWNVPFSDLLSDDCVTPIYLAIIPVGPTYLFIKLTFFIMYLEIFGVLRWMRIGVYTGAATLCAFYGAATVVLCYFSIARPGKTFLEQVFSAQGRKAQTFGVPFYAVGLAFDLYILALPITAVLNLQLSTRKKIGSCLIFLTGLFACLTAAINIYYRVQIVRHVDGTFILLPTITMSIVEMEIGVMCTCMPSFARMLHHHSARWTTFRSPFFSRFGYSSPSRRGQSYKKSGNTNDEWVQHSRPLEDFRGDGKGAENISLPSLGMSHPQKVQTFIEMGSERDRLDNERTHVGYRLQQKQQGGT